MSKLQATFLLAAFTFAMGPTLLAENVTCSSEDGGRHSCRISSDYSRVRMVNQRSGSACREGYSWGTDDRGIWVDHGCRADFEVERSSYSGGRGDGDGYGRRRDAQTVTCSSEDGGRHSCNVPANSRVRMARQRSGSACTEGYSWGTDDRGIWVDHGCRADFEVVSRRGGYRDVPPRDGGNYDSGRRYNDQGRQVNCSDESGNGTHCNVNVSGGVEMIKQRSGSPCRRGYSWGTDDTGIWVSHGCRADFVVYGSR